MRQSRSVIFSLFNSSTRHAHAVKRFVARSDELEMYMQLDKNTEIYPIHVGEKFSMALTSTLNLDGTPDSGYLCSFVRLLPSIIAASVLFLAPWTLDQSDHQHYTSYKTYELKEAVLALRELQLDTASSQVNAIREKYKHSKIP